MPAISEVLDGKTAYKRALRDLKSLHNAPEVLSNPIFKGRVYNEGEDGYGLILDRARKLVYISSESAEGLYALNHPLQIRESGWPESVPYPRYRNIEEIPKEAVKEVVLTAGVVKTLCRKALKQRFAS